MKQFPSLSSILLTTYAVYTAFVPVTIAHSIILFSLAALFAYNQFLSSIQNPSVLKEVAEFKRDLEEQMKKHKELYDEKLSGVEGELGKIAMSGLKSPSSASSKSADLKKIIF